LQIIAPHPFRASTRRKHKGSNYRRDFVCPASAILLHPIHILLRDLSYLERKQLAFYEGPLNAKGLRFTLVPETDVVAGLGHFVAGSTEPWLRVTPDEAFRPGSIIEITYRASLWDEPVRPVFRFWTAPDQWQDHIAPGPVAGAGIWTGRVPDNTIGVSVSPTNRPGRFDFQLETVRSRPFWTRMSTALRRGARAEPYAKWRELRQRRADLDGIDRPRCNWTQGAEIHLLLAAGGSSTADLKRTIAALVAQIYPRWTLYLVASPPPREFSDDSRIRVIAPEQIASVLRSLPDLSLAGTLAPGDEFAPHAFACLAEAAARAPQSLMFYGDEEFLGAPQIPLPLLKPGWSPVLQSLRPYLGRAVFFRAEALRDWPDELCDHFGMEREVPGGSTVNLTAEKVHPLRRVLLRRATPWTPSGSRVETTTPPAPADVNPSVLIVIPARDQVHLLSRCVASIFERTQFGNYSILIVDNDSLEEETKRFFEYFRHEKLLSVLHSPGAFNLSALSNAGAARRRADVLVFLQNGVEVLSEDWLDRFVAAALRPEAGAVGGRLLHGNKAAVTGLVLGSDAAADTSGPDGLPGWTARDEVLHEVSAVPGVCLAVARRKFMLAGGFDAEHLPGQFNDLDFCLRLAEHGWTSLIDPAISLRMPESPRWSRRELEDQAAKNWFLSRWRGKLRDDPYFHPALSLQRPEPALG
jgi:hypothetical protein